MSARIELHPVSDPPLSESPPSESPVPKTPLSKAPVSEPAHRIDEEDLAEPYLSRRSYGRTAVVLGVALSLVVAGWVLSEVQRGRELRNLELQIQNLESQLEQKNRALSAHEQRLDEVRDRVQILQELLDTPVLTPR